MIGRRQFLTGAALTLATPALAQTAGAPRTIRFASVGGTTDAPIFIAEDYGFFREAGMTVAVQRMTTAPALTAAIVTDQLDVAGISLTPGLYASVRQDMNLRLVGDKQSLRSGLSATRMIVRPPLAGASEAATMQGLKGRKVAVSSKAASTYYLLAKLLEKHGLRLDDIQVVEIAFPNMLPALTSGAIDGAVSLEPFLSQSVQAGAATVVSDLTEFVPPGGSIVPLVYSEQFARDRAAAVAFMKAYIRGVRVYNDAVTRNQDTDRVIGIIARYAKVDPKVIRGGYFAALDPNQKLDAGFLKAVQDFFVAQKTLREPIDVDRIVDTSFAEAALKDLGAYR